MNRRTPREMTRRIPRNLPRHMTRPMTFEEFTNRFGTDITSNHQLTKWAKDLGIPNFHVVMRDEVKDLPNTKPLNVIVNLEKSDQRGSDWHSFHVNGPNGFYFSSYGLPPLQEAKDYLRGRPDVTNRQASTLKMQDYGDQWCGQASLYFLYKMNNSNNNQLGHLVATEDEFEDTVSDMYHSVQRAERRRDSIVLPDFDPELGGRS